MEEVNISKEYKGFIYTIKSINLNCIIKCPHSCIGYEHSWWNCLLEEKEYEKYGILKKEDGFLLTTMTINVKNIGEEENCVIAADDALIIDNYGYSYEGIKLCRGHNPLNYEKYGIHILPQTQVDYITLFPPFQDERFISKVKVRIWNKYFDYNLSDKPNEIEILSMSYKDELSADTLKDYDLTRINNSIRNIKADLFSLKNNVLTNYQSNQIRNRIRTNLYALNLEIEEKPKDERTDIIKEKLKELDIQFKSITNTII